MFERGKDPVCVMKGGDSIREGLSAPALGLHMLKLCFSPSGINKVKKNNEET